MYRAYGLLQATSDFSLGEAATRLKSRFPDFTVEHDGNQIAVLKGDWRIFLIENADPMVLAESAELAEKIAGLEDGSEIAACARRVEVSSDIPDPMIEHLADFQTIIEVLRSFRGVIAVDPEEPALM